MITIKRRECTVRYMTVVLLLSDVPPQHKKLIRIVQMITIKRRECTVRYTTVVLLLSDVQL